MDYWSCFSPKIRQAGESRASKQVKCGLLWPPKALNVLFKRFCTSKLFKEPFLSSVCEVAASTAWFLAEQMIYWARRHPWLVGHCGVVTPWGGGLSAARECLGMAVSPSAAGQPSWQHRTGLELALAG